MGLLKDILNILLPPEDPTAPGNPEKSAERAPVSVSPPVSTQNTSQIKNKVEYDYKPFKALDSRTIRKLSSLRKPNTDRLNPPPVSAKWSNYVKAMAESFFTGHSDILQDSSGSIQSDHQIAMERLIQFFAAADYYNSWDYSFINQLQVSPGKLKWNYRTESYSCYDGGSGGTTDYRYWLELLYLPDQSWDETVDRFSSKTENTSVSNLYTGTLPGDDCDCLFWHVPATSADHVYFRNPFGLKGIYYFKDYYDLF